MDGREPLEFGEYLGDLLDKRKLKAADIAAVVGVEASYIRMCLSGKAIPDSDLVEEIAVSLNPLPDEPETLMLWRAYNDSRDKQLARDPRDPRGFARHLDGVLNKRGLTARGLAQMLCVDESYVGQWLREEKTPRIASNWISIIANRLCLTDAGRIELETSQKYSLMKEFVTEKLHMPVKIGQEAADFVCRLRAIALAPLPGVIQRLEESLTGQKHRKPGEMFTSVVLWNLGPEWSSGELEYYDQNGKEVWTQTFAVPPRSHVTVGMDEVNVAPGNYSTVITSSQPLTAITTFLVVSKSGTLVPVAHSQGWDGMFDHTKAALCVDLPLLVEDCRGFSTDICVMNTGVVRTSAQVEILKEGRWGIGLRVNGTVRIDSIMPHASVHVKLGEIPWLGEHFFGRGRVVAEGLDGHSGQELAVTSLVKGPTGSLFLIDSRTPMTEVEAMRSMMQGSGS